jgi:cytidylate kinase
MDNKRNEDINLRNIQEMIESLKKRQISDKKRYLKYYNINVNDKKHYDFILNTTNLSIEEVFLHVFQEVEKRLKNH